MSATMPMPSLADVDMALRNVEEVRGLLEAFDPCIKNMRAVLAAREGALRDCRESLIAHHAELAERERHEAAAPAGAQPVTASADTPVPAERLLSFASVADTSPIH
jgi:hypothetical protein